MASKTLEQTPNHSPAGSPFHRNLNGPICIDLDGGSVGPRDLPTSRDSVKHNLEPINTSCGFVNKIFQSDQSPKDETLKILMDPDGNGTDGGFHGDRDVNLRLPSQTVSPEDIQVHSPCESEPMGSVSTDTTGLPGEQDLISDSDTMSPTSKSVKFEDALVVKDEDGAGSCQGHSSPGRRRLVSDTSSLTDSPSSGKNMFTVTKVAENEDGSCLVSSDPNDNSIKVEEVNGQGSKNGGRPGKSHPAKSTDEIIAMQLQESLSGVSDCESSYGDSLTQSSFTKLLSHKFRATLKGSRYSYKSCKYEVSETNPQEPAPKPASPKEPNPPGIRKRLISRYESQDYDQCENALFMREQEKAKSNILRRKWLARWMVNLLIGVGTALVATIIEVCIEYSAEYKFLSLKKLVDWCDSGACMTIPLLVWVGINSTLVLFGALLVTCVEAAGSGIPQIKCYLNGVKIPGLLTLRALCAKAFGVILSVAGGLACGKEGPMIHSGAIVAAGVSQGRSRVLNYDFKLFEYLRSDTERRDFVSGGAAAGVSAAFGAPVGGVLFSLEEGASFWNQSLTWRIVFASMVATFSVNVILSAVHGHPADLSNPGLISFGQFPHITYHAIEIPIFLLMAVFGGFLGAIFNGINGKLTIFRKKFITSRVAKVFEAVLVSAMSAVLGFVLMYTVNDCVPDKGSSHHHTVQLHCPDGQHNVMSAIFFKTPESSLIAILHDDNGSYSVLSLSLFAGLYFLLACWTYGLSVSSGVFIPSLLTGAAWGRLVGIGVMALLPHMGYDYDDHSKMSESNNVGKYALIGAACQLGGTVRMTISLTVILIECTGDITFGLPIVMVLIIAKWVGDFFNSGLYDMHIQMLGIPLLPWEPPEMSYDITAKQVMNTPVCVLRTVEKVSVILDVLENMPHLHSGFPVVTDYKPEDGDTGIYGRCKGLILRSQLCLLVKNKVFIQNPGEQESKGEDIENIQTQDLEAGISNGPSIITEQPELKLADFRDAYPQYISSLQGVELTDDEKSQYINLEPYMNPSPYTVGMNASLPRMFRVFRGLGLRHLIVVNDTNQVVGMVTRKDLAKYRLKDKGGSIKMQELHIHND